MNKVPTMISAPRLKIKINGSDVAFAIGLNCSVGVVVHPVFTMGSVAGVSLEPLSYTPVAGTLQIYRLAEKASDEDLAAITTMAQQANLLSGATPLTVESVKALTDNSTVGGGNSLLAQSQLHMHLDPDTVLASSSFDIEIYMRCDEYRLNTATGLIEKVTGTAGEMEFLKIQDCRITGRNTNIAIGQLVNEPLSFQGLLAINMTLPEAYQETSDFFKDGVV